MSLVRAFMTVSSALRWVQPWVYLMAGDGIVKRSVLRRIKWNEQFCSKYGMDKDYRAMDYRTSAR